MIYDVVCFVSIAVIFGQIQPANFSPGMCLIGCFDSLIEMHSVLLSGSFRHFTQDLGSTCSTEIYIYMCVFFLLVVLGGWRLELLACLVCLIVCLFLCWMLGWLVGCSVCVLFVVTYFLFLIFRWFVCLLCSILFCLFDCWLLGFLILLFDLFTLSFWLVVSLKLLVRLHLVPCRAGR